MLKLFLKQRIINIMKAIDKKYTGVIVPMITPFNKDLSIDIKAVEKILNSFLEINRT